MSLTDHDLAQIRIIVRETVDESIQRALDTQVLPRLDEHSRILADHSRILDEHTRILNEHSATLAEHTRILEEHSQTLAEHSRILAEHSATLAEHTQLLREHGNILYEHDLRLRRIDERLEDIDGRLQAVEADIKELYRMVKPHKAVFIGKGHYNRLPPTRKIIILDAAVTQLATDIGVTLPR